MSGFNIYNTSEAHIEPICSSCCMFFSVSSVKRAYWVVDPSVVVPERAGVLVSVSLALQLGDLPLRCQLLRRWMKSRWVDFSAAVS